MYRKAITLLLLLNLTFMCSYLCMLGIQKENILAKSFEQTCKVNKNEKRVGIGKAERTISGERVVSFCLLENLEASELSEDEMEILLRIVEAEAGCEDEMGKLLIANVVLNRKNNENFPNTISEVVFQKENGVTQFSPVSNGRFDSVVISEETKRAVNRALDGEDYSEGALYFAARKFADRDKMKWFDENLEFLFRHGGHEFFRE